MVLSKKEKKKMVISLYEDGKTTRQIAKELRMSLRDIGIILREYNKEPEPKPLQSFHTRALEMFSKGKSTIQVATHLDITFDVVKRYYNEYLTLKNMQDFGNILVNYANFLPFFIHIAEKLKRGELFKEDVYVLIDYLCDIRKLAEMKYKLQCDVDCLKLEKFSLEQQYEDGKQRNLEENA